MKFKDNLRKQRTLAHLSQESLADKLSVSRQTISKWENGDAYPSMKHIFMLVEILGCDINSLVSENESKSNSLDSSFDKKYVYLAIGLFATLSIILLGFGFSLAKMITYFCNNDNNRPSSCQNLEDSDLKSI